MAENVTEQTTDSSSRNSHRHEFVPNQQISKLTIITHRFADISLR